MAARLAVIAILLGSCGLPLSKLAPFPCARGGTCPSGFACALGSCQPLCDGSSCPDGESCTGNGVCAPVCSGESCQSGACTRGGTCQDEVACASDSDCSMQKSCCGSTCIPSDADAANCGGCGITCPSDATCTASACVCDDPTLTACGQSCVDTQTDAANCSACGMACGTLESCVGGACACVGAHLMTCGDGACHDLFSDHDDCGTCDTSCSVLQICQDGTCVCDPMNFCGGNCVDRMTDANNCGACGHSCQGSTCADGRCKPIIVATGTQQIRSGIAVYGNYVSVAQSGTSADNFADGSEVAVLRTQVDGTIATSNTNLANPVDMVSPGNGYIYFTVFGTGARDGELVRCNFQGCASGMTILASGLPGPWGIATDGTNIYWADSGTSDNNYTDGDIAGCSLNGACSIPSQRFLIADGLASPNMLVVSGGKAYWTNSDGTVMSAPVSLMPGAKTTIASGRPNPYGITTNGTTLYWAERGTTAKSYADGDIVSCPTSGCASGQVTVLATNQSDPSRVLLDGLGNLYWNSLGKAIIGMDGTITIMANTGSLVKCTTAMCAPSAQATGIDTPYAIATDGNSIFMATWNGVSRIPR